MSLIRNYWDVASLAAALLGILILLVGWCLGYVHIGEPSRARTKERASAPKAAADAAFAQPAEFAIRQPSAEEVDANQEYCAQVRARARDLAGRFRAACTAEDLAAIRASLDGLCALQAEQRDGGHLGALGSTELCNALLKADVLEDLERLQKHASADVSDNASRLFQYVIPRIWSF